MLNPVPTAVFTLLSLVKIWLFVSAQSSNAREGDVKVRVGSARLERVPSTKEPSGLQPRSNQCLF